MGPKPVVSVVVVSDRFDHSQALAAAFSRLGSCTVVGPDIDWSNHDVATAIVFDATLASLATRSCLLGLQAAQIACPVLCLVSGVGADNAGHAQRLGATNSMSRTADPGRIARAVLGRTRDGLSDDAVVSLGVQSTVECIGGMLAASRAGTPVRDEVIREALDPLIDAVRAGGLSTWIDKVQLHDDATYRHCLLVAGLGAAFAVKAGFGERDRRTFAMASFVHDVGKARIPLAILNKPGPLDAGELAIMRTHPAIGHAILVEGGVTDPVVLTATLNHHEMIDGSGYPNGLSGDAVSDAVRFLTVCDIYAALTEPRSYKPAMSPREAIATLSSMRGKVEQGFVNAFAAMVTEPLADAA